MSTEPRKPFPNLLSWSFVNSKRCQPFDLFFKEVEFEIVEEHKGWFKPVEDDYYYYIDHAGMIRRDVWKDSGLNYYHYNHHNCFRSREEARECYEYREALKEAEKPFEINRDNYFIRLNSDGDDLFLDRHFICQYQGITYLGQDEEVAQAFIDKWKDCILKYEFGIFE